jgi:hypothetical protein
LAIAYAVSGVSAWSRQGIVRTIVPATLLHYISLKVPPHNF